MTEKPEPSIVLLEEKARAIADKIIRELDGRRGLTREIDEDIRLEIRDALASILLPALSHPGADEAMDLARVTDETESAGYLHRDRLDTEEFSAALAKYRAAKEGTRADAALANHPATPEGCPDCDGSGEADGGPHSKRVACPTCAAIRSRTP